MTGDNRSLYLPSDHFNSICSPYNNLWAPWPPLPGSPDLCPSIMSTDPTAPQPRVIVLCFDGTANQYDTTVSHLCVRSFVAPQLTCKNIRTQMSSSSTLCLTNLVHSNRLSITRFVSELSEPGLPPFRLNVPSRLIRITAWRRDFLQPRNCQSSLDMGREDGGRSLCMVHCSQLHLPNPKQKICRYQVP